MQKMDDGITAQVEYAYVAQEPDELNLTVGDIVKKCVQKEDGWMEGTLAGKRGMFPDNFVKVIKKVSFESVAQTPRILVQYYCSYCQTLEN